MFISHPLDTVKTNMQSGNMRFTQAAKLLFKTEGVSACISFTLLNFTIFCHCFAHRQNPIIGAFYFRCVRLVFWIRLYLAFMAIRSEYFKICKSIRFVIFVRPKWFIARVISFHMEIVKNGTSGAETETMVRSCVLGRLHRWRHQSDLCVPNWTVEGSIAGKSK